MLATTLSPFLLASTILDSAFGAAIVPVARDGSTPALTSDPNTTTYCSWWIDYTTAQSCSSLLADNAITLDTFRRWNPSITSDCGNLVTGHSYCVEAFFEPSTGTTTSSTNTKPPTTTTTTAPTTTAPSNGISTPTPTQPGMVTNCNKFHHVASGESCSTILSLYGISLNQFTTWNTGANADCSGLWAETYACVGVIGGTVTTVSATPTSTGNGISTPTPAQPSMVSNCDDFYYVVSGDNCASIASNSGISLSQFVSWNPSVGDSCSGLWLNTYVCISIVGQAPTPTKPGNGVATPTPIQDGMTTSCKTFHLVTSGEGCASISSQYGITTAQFTAWNPAVGSTCANLWANTYACVAIL